MQSVFSVTGNEQLPSNLPLSSTGTNIQRSAAIHLTHLSLQLINKDKPSWHYEYSVRSEIFICIHSFWTNTEKNFELQNSIYLHVLHFFTQAVELMWLSLKRLYKGFDQVCHCWILVWKLTDSRTVFPWNVSLWNKDIQENWNLKNAISCFGGLLQPQLYAENCAWFFTPLNLTD